MMYLLVTSFVQIQSDTVRADTVDFCRSSMSRPAMRS